MPRNVYKARYELAQTTRVCRICGPTLFSLLCFVGPEPFTLKQPWICARCGSPDGDIPAWAIEPVRDTIRKPPVRRRKGQGAKNPRTNA